MSYEPLLQALCSGLIVLCWSKTSGRAAPTKTNVITFQRDTCGWLERHWPSKTATLAESHLCIPAWHRVVQYHPAQGRILMEVEPCMSVKDTLTPG